jgi:hypothetical protein
MIELKSEIVQVMKLHDEDFTEVFIRLGENNWFVHSEYSSDYLESMFTVKCVSNHQLNEVVEDEEFQKNNKELF